MFLHPFLSQHRSGAKQYPIVSDESSEGFTRSLRFRHARKRALSLDYRLEIVELGLVLRNIRSRAEANRQERQKQSFHFEAMRLGTEPVAVATGFPSTRLPACYRKRFCTVFWRPKFRYV
jgi:sugar phosphate isomerase/epimerase